MTDFVYRPQVEGEIARGLAMAAIVEEYALRGAQGARTAAPHHTGYYEKTVEATVGADERGVVGVVYTTDFAGHIIEHGSANNPPYAPLRRGVELAGLRVTGGGRRG